MIIRHIALRRCSIFATIGFAEILFLSSKLNDNFTEAHSERERERQTAYEWHPQMLSFWLPEGAFARGYS